MRFATVVFRRELDDLVDLTLKLFVVCVCEDFLLFLVQSDSISVCRCVNVFLCKMENKYLFNSSRSL